MTLPDQGDRVDALGSYLVQHYGEAWRMPRSVLGMWADRHSTIPECARAMVRAAHDPVQS